MPKKKPVAEPPKVYVTKAQVLGQCALCEQTVLKTDKVTKNEKGRPAWIAHSSCWDRISKRVAKILGVKSGK